MNVIVTLTTVVLRHTYPAISSLNELGIKNVLEFVFKGNLFFNNDHKFYVLMGHK